MSNNVKDMLRIVIDTHAFEVLTFQDKQNPYIDINYTPHKQRIRKQHQALEKALHNPIIYKLRNETIPLPDIVFCANGGLSLPRLPGPMVLLPHMRYPHRKRELPYLIKMYKELGIPTVKYPGKESFEGQAELKWFHGGTKAVCGYGHRSTRQTYVELARFFAKIYDEPPELLVLPIISSSYYHLDVAMLEYADSKCIVHKRAFSPASIKKLQAFLGNSCVTVIDTEDSFCLNSVVDGRRLITHKLTDLTLKPMFEKLRGCRGVEVDTTEYENSGGSVRCMTLDVYV